MIDVRVVRVDPGVPLPSYAHPGDAGADLVTVETIDLAPGERTTVGTGIAVEIPEGFVGFINPRSGLAARTGLTIVNAPGTIDAGYRGEIKVCLLNTDRSQPVHLERGDRIAQLVIVPVARARFVPTDALGSSARGLGGYGSTGGSDALTNTAQETP